MLHIVTLVIEKSKQKGNILGFLPAHFFDAFMNDPVTCVKMKYRCKRSEFKEPILNGILTRETITAIMSSKRTFLQLFLPPFTRNKSNTFVNTLKGLLLHHMYDYVFQIAVYFRWAYLGCIKLFQNAENANSNWIWQHDFSPRVIYSAHRLIGSLIIESAANWNQIFLVPSYLDITQKAFN